MILGYLLLAVGIAGFGFCGYKDLKTTEFPDWAPYSIIIAALVIRTVFSFFTGDWTILTHSLFWGALFLGFGMALYFSKQWGDGDAWLLGALGFLFPTSTGFLTESAAIIPFPITLLANFFIISFVYMIGYAMFIGVTTKNTKKRFSLFIKKDKRGISAMIGVFTTLSIAVVAVLYLFYNIALIALTPLLLFPVAVAFLVFFLHYGKFIEREVFRKKIPVSKLRVGDVPANEKWRVLSKKEVSKLKKRGGTIWIKEGVRFAPAFLITLLVTLYFGNVILLFIG